MTERRIAMEDLGLTNFRWFLKIQSEFAKRVTENPETSFIFFSEHHACYSVKPHELKNAGNYFRLPLSGTELDLRIVLPDGTPIPVVVIPQKGGRPAFHGQGVLGVYIIGRFSLTPDDFLRLLSKTVEAALKNIAETSFDRLTNPYDLWLRKQKVVSLGIHYKALTDNQIITTFGANVNYRVPQKFLDALWPCGDKIGLAGSLHDFPEFANIKRGEILHHLQPTLIETLTPFLYK